MSLTNPATPDDISRTLRKAKWKLQSDGNWLSPSGNLHNYQVAIYLHSLGQSNAKLVAVPDNKALRSDKPRKPGLGHGSIHKAKKEPVDAPKIKAGRPAVSDDPRVLEVHRYKKEGYSLRATAKQMGIAQTTVHRLLHLKP